MGDNGFVRFRGGIFKVACSSSLVGPFAGRGASRELRETLPSGTSSCALPHLLGVSGVYKAGDLLLMPAVCNSSCLFICNARGPVLCSISKDFWTLRTSSSVSDESLNPIECLRGLPLPLRNRESARMCGNSLLFRPRSLLCSLSSPVVGSVPGTPSTQLRLLLSEYSLLGRG